MVIRIQARVANAPNSHRAVVATNGASRDIDIAARATGFGSSANGGGLLCLALAACYCNDVYREAAARAIEVTHVAVHVDAEFGAPGAPARAVRYRADVTAQASEDDIRAPSELSFALRASELIRPRERPFGLMLHTDSVAEIRNTVRLGLAVEFTVGAIVAGGAR